MSNDEILKTILKELRESESQRKTDQQKVMKEFGKVEKELKEIKAQLSEVMPGLTADMDLLVEDRIAATNHSLHGVAVGVDLQIEEQVREVEIPNKNIIAIKYKTRKENMILANIYLPTQGKEDELREALDCITMMLSMTSGVDKFAFLGDTNVDCDGKNKKRLGIWKSFIDENGLTDCRTGAWTHYHKWREKIILLAAERRRLVQEVEREGRQYRVPASPFKSPMLMILSDFSSQSKREVRDFCQVYTGVFWRRYKNNEERGEVGCLVCGANVPDNTEHLLGDGCGPAAACPRSQDNRANVQIEFRRRYMTHPIATFVVSEEFKVRFILDPTS